MANLTINDLSAASAVTDSMQFEVDTGGVTSEKVTAAQLKTYIESVALDNLKILALNAQIGTTYTLTLADGFGMVTFENAGAITVTIPTNASVAFPTGTQILLGQKGAGTVTLQGDTGVTVNGTSAGSVAFSAQWGVASAMKIGTDAWWVFGGLA